MSAADGSAPRLQLLGPVKAWRGETERCFEWLHKAEKADAPGLRDMTAAPLFDNVKGDPRWLPFLRRIGRAPEQLAAVRFNPKST